MPTNAGLQRASRVTDLTGGGTTGNYTMTPGARLYEIEMLAGGTGGGSGRKGLSGTVCCGGGGGGGSSMTKWTLSAATLLALYPTGLVPYQVGLGTAGGTAISVASTNGNAGTAPSSTTRSIFGPLMDYGSLGAGSGGTSAAGTGGSAGIGTTGGSAGGAANTSGGIGGGAGSSGAAAGGGAGGGIATVAAAASGGTGGIARMNAAGSPGTNGVAGGASPTAGSTPVFFAAGFGAGGGASSITGNAQDGADALHYGGGGGGGGAALDTFGNSGRGGNGGDGRIRIVEVF